MQILDRNSNGWTPRKRSRWWGPPLTVRFLLRTFCSHFIYLSLVFPDEQSGSLRGGPQFPPQDMLLPDEQTRDVSQIRHELHATCTLPMDLKTQETIQRCSPHQNERGCCFKGSFRLEEDNDTCISFHLLYCTSLNVFDLLRTCQDCGVEYALWSFSLSLLTLLDYFHGNWGTGLSS